MDRGCIVERAQPFTTYDLDLVQRVLERHDEIVIGIGSAQLSHEIGQVMTAGERYEVIHRTLQAAGIPAKKYTIIPIEDVAETSQWVADVRMLTPRWNNIYTRNFKNAAILASFERQFSYTTRTIPEQQPTIDRYEALARGNAADIPDAALESMERLGILHRVNTIYNRKDITPATATNNRALFLGGLQPLTGVFAERTGHLGAILRAFDTGHDVVIAIGSAQCSHSISDPLTAGKRIEVVREALIANGIDPNRFSTIPIKDIPSNAGYAAKVVSHCPSFNAVVAGNDWTKQLFGEGKYDIIPLERDKIPNTETPISATRVRETAMRILREEQGKDGPLHEESMTRIECELRTMVDPSVLRALREVGFYDTMRFLAFAKE